MKKKLLMIPFIAALALAGCTNGEEPGIDTPNGGDGQIRYLAVNIVTPAGVRADGGYEQGSADEDAVETATFLLLDNNGISQVCADVDLKPWKGEGDYDPNVENISSAVLLIEKAEEKPAVKGIIAILNADAAITGKFSAGKTLNEVKAILGDCASDGAKGSFIMTNSVYYDNAGALKIAADVEDANLGQSEDAAKNNPVDIYVERVVARVDTTAGTGITNTEGAKIDITNADGTKTSKTLSIEIKGIAVENRPNRSYLLKNIDDLYAAAPWTNWNDAANYRSYWAAKMPDATADNGFAFQLHSWDNIQDANAHTTYVQENISDTNHTAVIVTAQLKDGNAPFELVKMANTYYLPADALKQIAGGLNNRHYRIKDTANSTADKTVYTSIPDTYLAWADPADTDADFEAWEGCAKLATDKESEVYYEYIPAHNDESGNPVAEKYEERTAAEINNALKAEDLRVLFWNEGMCYYYVDIEHHKDAAATKYGVIRNHVYKLNLQSIKGVGVPVFDPDQEIYPKKPTEEELFYLAARVNILKWKIVNQTVDLE